MAEDDDPFRRHADRVAEVPVRRVGIAVEPVFARRALALAVPAVVEGQQAQAEPTQAGVVVRPTRFGDVARVAVADEQPGPRSIARRHRPGHQPHAVRGGDGHPAHVEAELGGRVEQRPAPAGDVEHPGFAETEDQEDDEVAERGDREQSQESGHAG